MKNKKESEKENNRTTFVLLLTLFMWFLIYFLLMEDILSFSWGWIIALCVLVVIIGHSASDAIFSHIEEKEPEPPITSKGQDFLFNLDKRIKIEEEVEGKTISTVASNDVGIIIRFTDGTKLSYINNELSLENDKKRGK